MRRSVPLLALLACACAPQSEVRTAFRAVEVAQATLREAGINEHAVASNRRGEHWVVITRSEKSTRMGHVITVEAATGKVAVERYHSVQLGFGKR